MTAKRYIIGLGILIVAFLVMANSYHIYLPNIGNPIMPAETETFPPAPTAPPETPAPTMPPEPTASPEPTMHPRGVHILLNQSWYVDNLNYLHILGEVQNDTSHYVSHVKISVDIFTKSDHLVATEFTMIRLKDIPPQDRTCFNISLKQPSDWDYYRFEDPTYWTEGHITQLAIYDDSGLYHPRTGFYNIIGLIQNYGNVPVQNVEPVGTLYNAYGTVVGCHFTPVNAIDLLPGQVSAFNMFFYGRDYADVTSYRLQVDGTLP